MTQPSEAPQELTLSPTSPESSSEEVTPEELLALKAQMTAQAQPRPTWNFAILPNGDITAIGVVGGNLMMIDSIVQRLELMKAILDEARKAPSGSPVQELISKLDSFAEERIRAISK